MHLFWSKVYRFFDNFNKFGSVAFELAFDTKIRIKTFLITFLVSKVKIFAKKSTSNFLAVTAVSKHNVGEE